MRNFAPASVGAVITSPRTSLTAVACAAALLAGALTGCSSSGSSSNTLTKAQFVAQADAVCAATLAKIKAAPTPTSTTDYADILSYDSIALDAEPAFQSQITALADRSPDAAALHKNWIDIDKADYESQKPLVLKLDAAAQAKNANQVNAVITQLGNEPDHSTAEANYLTGYGLTDCASLANFGNSGS